MKITIFSESPTDEAAIKILIEAILGEEIEEVPRPNQLRSRGVDAFLQYSPVVIRSAYYQTESEAVVLVCDSNDKPVHIPEHDEKISADSLKCRFCILKRKVDETLESLKPIPNRAMIKVAIGVAVPAIEAWFMCGKQLDPSEDKWIRKQHKGETVRYDKTSLKRKVYGERSLKNKRIEIAIQEAERLAKNLELLNEKFPNGFGSLAIETSKWKD